MMPKFSREELIERAFLRAATVMFGMWEERGSSDTRLLIPPLIPDEFVIIGESINGREHREHIIPRVVICNQCHKMFSEGVDINTVARFIRNNLKIIYISKDEQHLLDNGKQLNLRQRMPTGWSFESGDIYVRLNTAKIEFRIYDL
ncbi:MAG: hypothetical protein WCK96_15350 [Methylococcales bacterium]